MEMLWLVLILVAVSFAINIFTVYLQKLIDVNSDDKQKGIAKEITTGVLKAQRFNSTLLPIAALLYVFLDRYYIGLILLGVLVFIQILSLLKVVSKAKENGISLKIQNKEEKEEE
ncbi:hypothetical protein PRVXH_001615 [Proteinivorax hydrogeniformans]|uniref:Uncharacterized protein n=1 Tax=Proteinivorax hydrogeniformans TaxID=1826727 RepID=A0AAU8HPZ7_9FIRM